MTAATKAIITAAIRADLTITPGTKAKLMRSLTSPTAEPEMKLFTEKQAALVLGVSVPTVARMKRDGQLKTVKIRSTSRITADSLYAASAN